MKKKNSEFMLYIPYFDQIRISLVCFCFIRSFVVNWLVGFKNVLTEPGGLLCLSSVDGELELLDMSTASVNEDHVTSPRSCSNRDPSPIIRLPARQSPIRRRSGKMNRVK